jgi:hypothetical protein
LRDPFPLRPTEENVRAQQAALSYTYSGASWLNEARFSFTRMSMYDTPESAFQTNVIQQLGIEGLTSDPANYGLPYFQLADYSLVTDDPTLPQVQRDNFWNALRQCFLDARRAHHQDRLRLDPLPVELPAERDGARILHLHRGVHQRQRHTRPDRRRLADFLLGFPQNTSRDEGNTQAYLRQNSFGGFVQDDWRVTPRLTLNLGLRYEYVTPYTETRGDLLNLVYAPGPNPPPPQLQRVSQAVSADTRNFAPRVGLAWRLPQLPFSKGETVFRAGYGIYYSPEIAVEIYDLLLNGIVVQNNVTDGSQAPILTTRNGFPQTASTGFPTYFGIDPHAPTPYVQQWNAGFQHEFAGHILGEVSYVGSKGTHLGRFRQFNTPLQTETGADLSPRPGDLQSLRTWPSLGEIIQRQHIANSSYNALQAKAEKRLTGHVSLLASFVWSKSIDDADTVIPGFYDSVGAQDENNLRLERALSSFNVGRRISGGYVIGLAGGARLRAGAAELAIDRHRYAAGRSAGQYLLRCFRPRQHRIAQPAQYRAGGQLDLAAQPAHAGGILQYGCVHRARALHIRRCRTEHLNGPGNNVFDMALHRRFPIRERGALEFRAEAFNIFNHPNWGIPGPYADFGAPYFGGILGVGDPRRLQFAIRYDF